MRFSRLNDFTFAQWANRQETIRYRVIFSPKSAKFASIKLSHDFRPFFTIIESSGDTIILCYILSILYCDLLKLPDLRAGAYTRGSSPGYCGIRFISLAYFIIFIINFNEKFKKLQFIYVG